VVNQLSLTIPEVGLAVIPVVSSRKSFYEAGKLSGRDRIKLVNLSDPRPSGFNGINTDKLRDMVRGRHVVLLVHGYNSSFEKVCSAYDRIIGFHREFSLPGDVFLGYLWPGGNKFFHYWTVRRKTKQVSIRLVPIISLLERNARRVDAVAHSLGCLITLKAMQIRGRVGMGNLYFMAAAVRNYMLSSGRYFSQAVSFSSGVYVFKSRNDMVLSHGFPIGESGAEALGWSGPVPFETVARNTVEVDCSCMEQKIRHRSYSRRSEIYSMISRFKEPVSEPVKIILSESEDSC
jgi:esterase/lipase superfamily enzyme